MRLSLLLDALPLILFGLASLAIVVTLRRGTERQFRGSFGRPYGFLTEELMAESQRRDGLLVRFVESREARLERIERRLEKRT